MDPNFHPQPEFHATPTRPRRQASMNVGSAAAAQAPQAGYNAPPLPDHAASQHQQYHNQQQPQQQDYWPNQHQQQGSGYGGTSPTTHMRERSATAIDFGGQAFGGQQAIRNRADPSRGFDSPQPYQTGDTTHGNNFNNPYGNQTHAGTEASLVRPSYDTPFDPSLAHDPYQGAMSTTHLVPDDDHSVYSKSSAFVPGQPGPHEAIPMNGYGQGYQQQPYHPSQFSQPMGMPQPMPEGPHVGWAALGAPGTMIATAAAGDMRYRDAGSYAQAREKVLKRRSVKHIELQQGNLVMECPVPRSICKGDQAAEFSSLRYQAVTCDPNDFIRQRFTLRPWLAGRTTELAIVCTQYNEEPVLFHRTISSVMKNIAHLTTRTNSKTWGADAWKKVVVVVVSDGRKKAHPGTLKMLQLMGLFSEGMMKDHVLDKPTQAHVFELTTQVLVSPDGTVQVAPCPVQFVFCLKEQNKKKLNSHRWFFNAFCEMLQPNVTTLIDVGTKPGRTSIYDLWKVFDKNKNVGGACGEMRVDLGRGCWNLVNPLVAAQNFEYKISNILDKSLEDCFGFISVLPGAFSAYRYKALKGVPLQAYFKGEAMHSGEVHAGTFTSNMYLAEDRILCFELCAKRGEAWVLRYVRSAKASTDVPDNVSEFIGQRRRWLNGSLLAGMYALGHFFRIWSSGHNFFRKLWLTVQAVYNVVMLIFTWTSLGNFFLAFFFLVKSATSDPDHDPFGGQGDAVLEVFQNLYIAMIVVVLICSLGNRPQGSKAAYMICIIVFAIIMGITLYCAGYTTYIAINAAGLLQVDGWTKDNILSIFKTPGIRDIVISLAATVVLYLLASIAHLDPWHMFTSFIQYLFLTPFYINILTIYSMSNLHDLSWGTKSDGSANTDLGAASGSKKDGKDVVEVSVPTSWQDAEELWSHAQHDLATPKVEEKKHRSADQKQQDHAANFRTNLLLFWMGTNAALIIVFTSTWWLKFVRTHLYGGDKVVINPYTTVLFWSTAGLAAVRAFGSFLYAFMALFGR